MDVRVAGDKIIIPSHYNKVVKERFINSFSGRVWKGGAPPNWRKDSMHYEAPVNPRNLWVLDYFDAHTPSPYTKYTKQVEPFGMQPRFSKAKGKVLDPMPHQEAMASHWWAREQCHIAAEMRTGKTLPVLSVIERLGKRAWYIGPKSAIAGVEVEIWNWGFNLQLSLMTYDALVSSLKEYGDKLIPPEVIVFDESHALKTWTTLRTQAAFHVCNEMRRCHDQPYIVAMTGTPSPKNPADFWSQIEVVRPGFLAENSFKDLEEKIYKIEYKDNETGGQFPVKAFCRNSDNICDECGRSKNGHDDSDHGYVPARNEVKLLGERLRGISIKFLKRDCMNLPEKIYEMIELKPSRTILKYAAQIKRSASSPAVALNELAQLSAGFYYKEVPDETRWVDCPKCWTTGKDVADNTTCTRCEGNGRVHPMKRVTEQVECPKEDKMIELLDEAESAARFVAFGGFLGCIDRMEQIALRQGWKVIKIDGRGFKHDFESNGEALKAFANIEEYPDKLCVVAHPATGGTGVSYSASPTIMYWHNPFDGAARMQSIERGTDMGMDMTRGCRIVDLVQLPVDKYILENLDKKVNLQSIALEEL
jgi:hypothetical protein